jgi:hypothetical protein
MSSDEELDDTQVRFQEAHGSRLFRQGKPRAVLRGDPRRDCQTLV